MMHFSVVVLASIIGLAVSQSQSECTDFEATRDCVLPLADQGITCQTAREIKKCYKDYCPEVSLPPELNSAIDICENGGTIPGSGSGTGSETGTPTGSGSKSTSTSGSGSGSDATCIDRQAYSDCVNPLARKEQTCDVILEIAECFANYCPDRAYQIEEDVAACSASGTGSGSGSGSTRTSSADDSESTDSNGGSGGTRTTSGADSTGTGIGSGFGGNSTIADPTNTSNNGDGPVSTGSADNEGAADRLFAPVGAIIGSLIAVMAWL